MRKSSPSQSIPITSFTEPTEEVPGEMSSNESLSASPHLAIKFTDLPAFLQRELVFISELRKAAKRQCQATLENDIQLAKARLKKGGGGSVGSAGNHAKHPSSSSIVVKSANSLKVSTTKSSGVSSFSSKLGGGGSVKSNPESGKATSASFKLPKSEPSKSPSKQQQSK
ncbi:hypothetical protein TYRP_004227 [Tyrophagus putrescentiae]|nr:hypothetical protein TYRP_004227 [Tyrophagus putrescentiae]